MPNKKPIDAKVLTLQACTKKVGDNKGLHDVAFS